MNTVQSISPASAHHFTKSPEWRRISDLFWVNVYKARMGHKVQRRKRQCRGIIKHQVAIRQAFTYPPIG